MRFTPQQPLPTWAEAKPEHDAFKPLWPVGSVPKGTRHESPTTYTKRD